MRTASTPHALLREPVVDAADKTKVTIWNPYCAPSDKHSNIGDVAIVAAFTRALRPGFENVQLLSLQDFYDNPLRAVAQIRESDWVVAGGGELIQDKTSLAYLLANLLPIVLAVLAGKHVALCGIGVGEPHELSAAGRLLSRLVLGHAELITVRDGDSRRSLAALGFGNRRIEVCADPSLLIEPCCQSRAREILVKNGANVDLPLVAISPRRRSLREFDALPVAFRRRLGLDNPRAYARQAQLFAEIADYIVESKDAQVVFVPMLTGSLSTGDEVLCAEVRRKMRNLSHATVFPAAHYTTEELVGVLGQMKFVISMALHTVVLASITGVPSIGLEGSSKIRRFADFIGTDSIVVAEMSYPGLKKTVDDLWPTVDERRERLMSMLSSSRRLARRNIDLLIAAMRKREGF